MVRTILLLFQLLLALPAWSFTTIQTSTSVGAFKSYQGKNHFQVFHSLSLQGIYSDDIQTDLNFILNNDFSVNKWALFPTQAKVTVPLAGRIKEDPDRQSAMTLGRQFFTEGFDLALLDGGKINLYGSAKTGAAVYAGALRSADMDADSSATTEMVGLSGWSSFFNFNTRAGVSARNSGFKNGFVFASAGRTFSEAPLRPSLFTKQEWKTNSFSFNQSTSELGYDITDRVSGRFFHSYINPRDFKESRIESFIYRLFSISPAESNGGDLYFDPSEYFRLSFTNQNIIYNSGSQRELARRYDLAADHVLSSGNNIGTVLTYLSNYGGSLTDFGVRYTYQFSNISRMQTEYDIGYLTKINNISGWVHHLRTGYETTLTERLKTIFNVEAERNQYFVFDIRTMVYAANYF